MSRRLVVFVDYQNAYREARRAFHSEDDPHFFGQFDPLRLGLHLEQDSAEARVLAGVRIYRGLPSSSRDPRSYSAARRQMDSWRRDPRVQVIDRPIRYPVGWPGQCGDQKPQEKGIDVALALDFAIFGAERRYDVGIVVSADTDLKPALEFVAAKRRAWGSPVPEVAAWSADNGNHSKRLSLPGERLYCHWIKRSIYLGIRDETDYTPR